MAAVLLTACRSVQLPIFPQNQVVVSGILKLQPRIGSQIKLLDILEICTRLADGHFCRICSKRLVYLTKLRNVPFTFLTIDMTFYRLYKKRNILTFYMLLLNLKLVL